MWPSEKVKLSHNSALGLQGYQAPRIYRQSAHECAKVVSLKHRPPLPPRPSLNVPGNHFCYCLDRTHGPSAPRRIKSVKNPNNTIGNRTRDIPASGTVPYKLRHRKLVNIIDVPYFRECREQNIFPSYFTVLHTRCNM
jgi:hypothetical protein